MRMTPPTSPRYGAETPASDSGIRQSLLIISNYFPSLEELVSARSLGDIHSTALTKLKGTVNVSVLQKLKRF